MSNLPEDRKYAPTHEWCQIESESTVCVGITDFAQEQLGDLVYVDLPAVGRELKATEVCAVVESVKTASDLHSPVTGTIVAINEAVIDAPETVNDHPYKTWLFKIQANDLAEMESLLEASQYQSQTE
jgi:glycine cleavage system H protein